MELGPTGFILEQYVSKRLREQGYTIRLNQWLASDCVRHEVDIVALKVGRKHFIRMQIP